jgi:hypothetical protein
VNEDIISRSTPLRFEDPYGTGKRYARLPAGEYGYSDAQGLYEWRRVPHDWPAGFGIPPGEGTILVRIQYSGGDRQGSSNGQMWHSGPEAGGRKVSHPHELGFQAAMNPARMN